jgi:hypothetical protein
MAMVLALVASGAAFEDPHGIGYDGHDWKVMSEQAKLAYIAGFLAGTATQQAIAARRANPKISIDAAVSGIVRAHTGTFPFGVSVYKNDLDDYYFYSNNLSTKIYSALIGENAGMLKNAPK